MSRPALLRLPSAGPILAQAVVPVYPTDSPGQVAERVLKEVREHRVAGGLPEKVALVAGPCYRRAGE